MNTEDLTTPMGDAEIEQAIQDTKPTGPRLTPAHIQAAIVGEDYVRLDGTTTTICYLTLRNGFVVTGESACISPENFDEKIGCEVAYKMAEGKVWMLEGYLLKEFLADAKGKSDLNPIFQMAGAAYEVMTAISGAPSPTWAEASDEVQAAMLDQVAAILRGDQTADAVIAALVHALAGGRHA